MQLLLPALGAVLLGVLAYDVLITVFHPQGRGGPINRTQNRWVWHLFRALGARRDRHPRYELLAFCGPIMAVLTIISWSVILIAGFVLIYYPFIASFPTSPSGAADGDLVKAIYYSGYVASTLGIGDVVAPTSALRIATVLESLGGFVLIPVSVTYVLAVYRELGLASTLALDIDGYFQRGLERVAEELSETRPYALDWADHTTRALLRITQAHSQYPILHYFHAADPSQALLVQLGQLVRLDQAVSEGDAGSTASPSLTALSSAVRRHLRVINRDIVPPEFSSARERDADDPEAQYRRILSFLLYDDLVARALGLGDRRI